MEYGYSKIADDLKEIENKEAIFDLVLKNTVTLKLI